MKLEFLSFSPAGKDEKYLGLASILVDGVRFLYKVATAKNGGIFVAPPAIKLNDKWIDAFLFDSRTQNEQIIEFTRKHVMEQMAGLNKQLDRTNLFQKAMNESDEKVPF